MERRRQKNRNRRLMLALLMLLISGIALTTATYAWFSANTIVTTEDINVKVTASSGISISADAIAYGKSIKYSDVVNFAKKVQNGDYAAANIAAPAKTIISNPEKLNPVTTAGQTGSGWAFFQGQLSEDSDEDVLLSNGALGSVFGTNEDGSTSDYTDGDYVAFDVYLRTSTAQKVKLSTNSRIGQIKLDSFGNLGEMEGLDTALRVGFQYLGSTMKTSQKEAYTINVINGELPTNDQWAIWNPAPWKSHSESLTAKYYSGSDNEVDSAYYAGIARSTDYIKHYYKHLEATPDTDHFVKITSKNSASKNHYIVSEQDGTNIVTPEDEIFTLEAGVNKVRIYIWLEGQDKDCVDSITLSEGLSLQVGFEVIK